jgi:hypothetical protein
VRKRADGSFEATSVRGLATGEVLAPNEGSLEAVLRPDPKGTRTLELSVVLSSTWDDAQQVRWMSEVVP